MADTAALVVALSAQLTKFEKDMQKAGIMADRAVNDIESKFSKMNPQVNASFFGNLFSSLVTKGIDAAVKAAGDLVDRFLDLQKAADYAGVSMQWLYGVQEAGAKAGASIGDMNTAVRSLAFMLDEMKRGGDNALTKLFDANPQFLKGVNRDALDLAQTMKIVGNIIGELPNQVQRVDVAKNLGMPEGSVAAFREGGDALERMATAASRTAPDLERIAAQSKAIKEAWKDFTDDLTSGVIERSFAVLKAGVEALIQLILIMQGLLKGGPLEDAINQSLEKWRQVEATLNKAKEQTGTRVRIQTGGGGAVDPFARTGGGGDRQSAFDRQNDQITKHIALMEADTAAVGKNVGEQERLKTIALLKTAAERDGVVVTAEMTRQMEAQADAAARARLALAQAQHQLAQINQASQVLGSAISTAFSDAIVEGKKLNEVLDSLVKTLLKAAINSTIMSLFTPGAGGGMSPIMKGFGFAGGTDFAPGGLALVGEKGPELVNLPRGSQVIPNDVLRQGGSQGGAIIYSPAIDARGASVEAVARLAQIIEADRAAFASRTVATIQQARRARLPGV